MERFNSWLNLLEAKGLSGFAGIHTGKKRECFCGLDFDNDFDADMFMRSLEDLWDPPEIFERHIPLKEDTIITVSSVIITDDIYPIIYKEISRMKNVKIKASSCMLEFIDQWENFIKQSGYSGIIGLSYNGQEWNDFFGFSFDNHHQSHKWLVSLPKSLRRMFVSHHYSVVSERDRICFYVPIAVAMNFIDYFNGDPIFSP